MTYVEQWYSTSSAASWYGSSSSTGSVAEWEIWGVDLNHQQDTHGIDVLRPYEHAEEQDLDPGDTTLLDEFLDELQGKKGDL